MLENTTETSAEISAAQYVQPALEKAAFWVALITSFLMPILVVPSPILSIGLTKNLLLSVGTIVALILWLISRLKEGTFLFQKTWLAPAGILLALVSLISSFFSSSFTSSFIGDGASIDTFSTIFISVILMLLISQVVSTRRQILLFFGAFFTSLFVVGIFQIVRLAFGVDFLSLGVLGSNTSNLIGKWNDLGIFFGLGVLLSLLSIEFLKTSRLIRVLFYTALLVSLFFLVLINFVAVWVTVGILAFVLLVYILSSSGNTENQSANRRISGVALLIVALSLVSIISGNSIGNVVSSTFGVGQVEARPNWAATLDIANTTIKKSPLLGVGPNRFFEQWLLHKPEGINETAFWNIDFNFGIGYIPTTLTTSGVLGALSWLLFVLLFLWIGIKVLFAPISGRINKFLLTSSYFGALYLWIFMFIYIPNIVIFSLAFIFTGLFISSATKAGLSKTYTFNFIQNPRLNFSSVLVSIVLVIASATAGYFIIQRYVASAFVGSGLQQLVVAGDIDRAERDIERGISLNRSSDIFFRTLTDVKIAKLNALLQNADAEEEKVRGEFQNILAGALESARSAVQIDTANYANWVSLGRVYESIVPLQIEGAYQSALDVYEQALANNPHAPGIYLTLARLEVTKGDNDTARARLADALAEKK